MTSGETLEAAYVNATATIGEKKFTNSVVSLLSKKLMINTLVHTNTTVDNIGVVTVIEGGDEALAKQISMHVAAGNSSFIRRT